MSKKVLAVAVILVLAAASVFAFDGYVEVVNDTGFDIYFVYLSNEYSDDWEEDVLNDDVLLDGESVAIEVNDAYSSIFDIRLEDEDGDTYTVWGVDIAEEDVVITLADLD